MFDFLKIGRKRKGVSIVESMLIVALVSLALVIVFGALRDGLKATVMNLANNLKQSSKMSQEMASNS